jgi:hypothetical protein
MQAVKGALPFMFKKYIKDNFGNDYYKEILESLSADSQNVINGILVSHKMYPIDAYNEFLDAFMKKAGKDELMKFGRSKAEYQLRGLYGFITRLLSLEIIAARATKSFSNTYKYGSMVVEQNTPERIILKVEDFEYTEALAVVTLALVERIIEISSGKLFHSLYKNLDDKTTLFIFNVV